MRKLDSCSCWRCTFNPCKVRNRFLVNFWNRTIVLNALYFCIFGHPFWAFLRTNKDDYVENKSVRQYVRLSVCQYVYLSASLLTQNQRLKCQIFKNVGTEVLYKKLSAKREFHEYQLSKRRTLPKVKNIKKSLFRPIQALTVSGG
jgi:hypothetical protein